MRTPRRTISRKVSVGPIDWRFYLALVIGALFSAMLYYFFIGIREFSRHGISMAYYIYYEPLSESLLYFYNFYFAFITGTVGFAIFCNMWLLPKAPIPERIRAMSHYDQIFLPGYFVYLSLKLSFIFGLLFFSDGIMLNIDFFRELWPLFFCSMIVLFLQQWLTLRRSIKEATGKAMAWAAGIQISFALLLAAIPVYDIEALDRLAEKHSPHLTLELNLPESKVYRRSQRRSLTEQMHVGNLRGTNQQVISFGRFESKFISLETLPALVLEAKDRLMENERDQLTIELYADKDVSAKQIIALRNSIRWAGNSRILLMTKSVYYSGGVPLGAPPYCSEIQYPKRLLRDDSPPLRWDVPPPCGWGDKLNIVELKLENNKMLLNDSIASADELYQWAQQRILDHANGKVRTAVHLTVDDKSNYASLVLALDRMLLAATKTAIQVLILNPDEEAHYKSYLTPK